MATDTSPPRIRVILTIAFSSVVILTALQFVFRSYFQMMTEEVEKDHLRPPEQLLALRAGEEKNLTSGPLPIDKAMALLAQKGREGEAEIKPEPSTDMGPMVGWIRTPNQAVIDKLTAEANAPADAGAAPATTGDGGAAAVTGDAGAPTGAVVPDAGADAGQPIHTTADGGAGKGTTPTRGPTTAAPGGAKGSSDGGAGPSLVPPGKH